MFALDSHGWLLFKKLSKPVLGEAFVQSLKEHDIFEGHKQTP